MPIHPFLDERADMFLPGRARMVEVTGTILIRWLKRGEGITPRTACLLVSYDRFYDRHSNAITPLHYFSSTRIYTAVR